eukprot:scaffold15108_cov180-Amphora_coffeaeformis.AAC.77
MPVVIILGLMETVESRRQGGGGGLQHLSGRYSTLSTARPSWRRGLSSPSIIFSSPRAKARKVTIEAVSPKAKEKKCGYGGVVCA